jgi:putative RNA ligase
MDPFWFNAVVGASASEIESAAAAGVLGIDDWNGMKLYSRSNVAMALPEHARAIEVARGLVLDSGAVVRNDWPISALPLMFFRDSSYLEHVDVEVEDITEKLDGALAISFTWNDSIRWAGRSSFSSPVALRANALWQERYADTHVPTEVTLSCEVIHPETKVLIDYGFSDLVLIGARNRFTGEDFTYEELQSLARELGMPVVQREMIGLADAIRAVEGFTTQREGYVVRLRNGRRVKLSSPLYNAVYDLCKECTPWMISEVWGDGWDHAILAKYLPAEVREHAEPLMCFLDRELKSCQIKGSGIDRAQVVELYRTTARESLHALLAEVLPDDV